MEQNMSRRSGRSPAADESLNGCLRTFIRAYHSMNDQVKSSLGQQCPQRSGRMRLAVETNLDTRLYVLVPSSATFADLQGLVTAAHMRSFPQYGDVAVKELEVKIDSHWFHVEMTPDEFASDLPARNCNLRAELIRLPEKALPPMEKVALNVAPRGAEDDSASPVCKTSMPTKHVMESLQQTGRKRKSSSQTCKIKEKRRRPTAIEHKCTSTGLLIEGNANQKESLEVHVLAHVENRKVNVPSAIEGSNAVEDIDPSNEKPNLGVDENYVLAGNHSIQVSSDKCLSHSSPSSNDDSESSSKGSSGANDRENQIVDSDLQRNTHIKNIVATIDDRVETQSFSHESPPNDREIEKGSDEVNVCKQNLLSSKLLASVKHDNLTKSVNVESQNHSQVNGKGLILPTTNESSINTDVSNYDEDERYGGRHSDSEPEDHHNDTHGIGNDKNDVCRGDVQDDEMERHLSAHGSSGDESETKLSDSEFEDRDTGTPAGIRDDKNNMPRGKIPDNEVKEHHSAHGSSGDESETKLSDDELEEDHASAHDSSDDEKKKFKGKHLSNRNQEHQADIPTATKTSECMGQMGSSPKSACDSKLNRNSLSEQTSPDKTLFEDGQPQSLSPSMNDSASNSSSTDNSESRIHQRLKKNNKQAPKAQQKSATIPQNARRNPRTRAAADAKYQPFIDSLVGLDLALVWQCKRTTNGTHAVVGSSVPNSMLETQSMDVVVETQDEKVIAPKGPAGGGSPEKDYNQTSLKAQGGMTSPPSYRFQDKVLDQHTDIGAVGTLNRSMAISYDSLDKMMDKCNDLNVSPDRPDTSSRRERSNLDTPSPASRRPRERVIHQTKGTGDVAGLDLSNKMDTDENPSTDLNEPNICNNGPLKAGLHVTNSSRNASDTGIPIINLDIQMDASEKKEIARIELLQEKPRKEIPDVSRQEEGGINGRRHRDIYEFSDHDKPSSSSDPFASQDSDKDVAIYSFRQGEHELKEKSNVSNVAKQRKHEASAPEENKQGNLKKKRSRGQEVPSVNERKMVGCQGFDVLGRVNSSLFKKCPCKYCRTWVASREVVSRV